MNRSRVTIELPVKNISKSLKFYKALGFSHANYFSIKELKMMFYNDNIVVWLATHKTFKEDYTKAIANNSKTTSAIYGISVGSKKRVGEIVKAALAAGGKLIKKPKIYKNSFKIIEDPDGYIWEVYCLPEKNRFPLV